jgi:hypothetical protein
MCTPYNGPTAAAAAAAAATATTTTTTNHHHHHHHQWLYSPCKYLGRLTPEVS